MRVSTILVALFAILASCAPVDEPTYRLEPPAQAENPETQSCLAACAATRDACLAPAQQQFAACDARAAQLYNRCERNASIDFEVCIGAYKRTGVTCRRRLCQRPLCSRSAIETCEADYRRCFAACGGRVVEE